jgi:hypothetical protein
MGQASTAPQGLDRTSRRRMQRSWRDLGWQYGIPTVRDAGYYVLQIGTAVCVVLSVLLVATDHPNWSLFRRAGLGGRTPIPTA